MGSATLTGTEFARVTKSYSSYSLSWIGSYTYTQDPVANTTTFTLYGSMYTGSSSNVRSANSTDVEQVNGVTISPPTPTAYRYSSSMEYGFSVNSGYSLFGSTTKTVTHNADGSFPSTSISIYSKNYHHNGLSASGAISAPAIDRSAPTVTASATQASETTVTLSVSANVNCNKWEYKVDSGSWVSFSTTNTTSVSTTVSLTTGASHTITARATKTYNGVIGTSSGVSVDKTAPTVSCSATNNAATSVSLSASSNVNCNKWEYRIGSGSWTTFSSTNGTSASTTVSGLSAGTTGTITVRATKTANYVTSTASASYDKTVPTITSASTSNVGANSCTLSVSANVNCNKWEYQIGSGSWVTFSSTNGTSASASITGLSPATTYTINVRVTKTANYVTASSSTSASTLGYSQIDSIANINVDNSAIVKFTPYSASFYFKVAFSLGGTTIATNTIGCPNKTTQHSYTTQYTFPASLLPASTSGTVTATLYTYTNSSYNVLVGSATKTFTITVPNTATYQPSGSLTLTPYNTNTWINNKGLYVGGYSAINIKVNNPAGGSGSTISTTVVNPTSTTVSTNNYRTSTLSAGTQNVSVVLTDRRGRSTTLTASASFLSYSSPSVATFATERGTYSNGTWTPATDGNHIRATVTTSCSLSTNGNTATATVRCVIGGTATAPNATSGNYYYWTGTTSETTYNVNVSVTDSVGSTTTFTSIVNAIAVPFNLNTSMPAAAFGKIAEQTKTLEIAPDWKLTAEGKANTFAYMPYSWETTAENGSAGYARVATLYIHHAWVNGPITFKIFRRNDFAPIELYLFFAGASSNDPDVQSFHYYKAGGGRTANALTVNAFVYKTATSTWDVYIQKSEVNEGITISTEMQVGVQYGIDITYATAFLSAVPNTAISATQLPIVNTAKNNAFAYMPYSASTAYRSGNYGWIKIATITITGTWVAEPITFTCTRLLDNKPTTLYLRFPNVETTDPSAPTLYYDDISSGTFITNTTTTFNAFAYKLDTSKWGVYVQKCSEYDHVTVQTYVPPYLSARCTIDYSEAGEPSVPSGAVMAKPIPYGDLASTNYPTQYNYGRVVRFAIGPTSSKTITSSSECSLLISCTGWNANIRSGLYFISGYSDSSRADITTLKSASGVTFTAVSGQLAWTMANASGNTVYADVLVMWGPPVTIS